MLVNLSFSSWLFFWFIFIFLFVCFQCRLYFVCFFSLNVDFDLCPCPVAGFGLFLVGFLFGIGILFRFRILIDRLVFRKSCVGVVGVYFVLVVCGIYI